MSVNPIQEKTVHYSMTEKQITVSFSTALQTNGNFIIIYIIINIFYRVFSSFLN